MIDVRFMRVCVLPMSLRLRSVYLASPLYRLASFVLILLTLFLLMSSLCSTNSILKSLSLALLVLMSAIFIRITSGVLAVSGGSRLIFT